MRARGLVAAAFLVSATTAAVAVGPAACASEGNRAVLVVDTEQSGGQDRFCVTLPDERVSGIELIELAGQQHGLDYRLGFGGEAVCMLAGVGTEGDDCFAEYPDFWGYWRGDGSGGWSWSSTGAGSTTVEDGDVEGWSWGSGNDGSSHAQPPVTRAGDVCPAAGEPRQEPNQDGGSGDKNDGAREEPEEPAAAAAVEESGDAERTASAAPEQRARKRGGGRPDAPDVTERMRRSDRPGTMGGGHSVPLASTGDNEDPRGGPPPAGLVALGATALLAIGGGALVRRRRNP